MSGMRRWAYQQPIVDTTQRTNHTKGKRASSFVSALRCRSRNKHVAVHGTNVLVELVKRVGGGSRVFRSSFRWHRRRAEGLFLRRFSASGVRSCWTNPQ